MTLRVLIDPEEEEPTTDLKKMFDDSTTGSSGGGGDARPITQEEEPTYHSMHAPLPSRSRERLEDMANAVRKKQAARSNSEKWKRNPQSCSGSKHSLSRQKASETPQNHDSSGSNNSKQLQPGANNSSISSTSELSQSQSSHQKPSATVTPTPLPIREQSMHATAKKQQAQQKNANNMPARPTTLTEARQHVADFLSNSARLGFQIHNYPLFEEDELVLGRWLGRGGFSNVEELRGFHITPANLDRDQNQTNGSSSFMLEQSRHSLALEPPIPEEKESASSTTDDQPPLQDLEYEPLEYEEEEDVTERLNNSSANNEDATKHNNNNSNMGCPAAAVVDEEMCRRFLVQNCLRESGEARYAIKRLRTDILHDSKQYPLGAMDLAIEALFLSDLQHPNIIKLRGLSSADPFTPPTLPHQNPYFLILDRLYDTLWDRIKKWRERKRKLTTIVGRLTDPRKTKKQLLLDERLAAAFDLSAAMSYLKEQKIIHRDLKPENIGFDIRGDIKIFDFGLARELRDIDKDVKSGMYHLSNMTGSLRYMSPEVAMSGTPYNDKADVYSFTIVLWEMLALQRAFMGVAATQEQFINEVFLKNRRPSIKHSWPKNIHKLLENGWIEDPAKRLSAEDCHEILRNELVSMRHGNDEGLDHLRRRSTYLADESTRDMSVSWTFQAGKALSTANLFGHTRTKSTDSINNTIKLPWAATSRRGSMELEVTAEDTAGSC